MFNIQIIISKKDKTIIVYHFQSYQLNIDVGTSSVQRFLLVFLSIVIFGPNSVIKQLQSRVEVDMR